MLLLDISLRFPAITLLLLMTSIGLLKARDTIQGVLGSLMCACVAGVLIYTIPPELPLPPLVEWIAWLLHGPAMVLFWLFGLSLFDEDFRLRAPHWAIIGLDMAILFTMPMIERHSPSVVFNGMIIGRHVFSLTLLAHLFIVALMGRDDDLVESRRSGRLFLILSAVLVSLILLNGETFHYLSNGVEEDSAWLAVSRSGLFLPLSIGALAIFFNFTVNFNLFSSDGTSTGSIASVSPQDRNIYQKLKRAIEVDKVYLQPGLSIGKLATQLNVPEHQLRALINQGLGYRNFSTFLNHYRLADAKAALADPELARTPILRIATDVGYTSLATFNRAFKAAEEMTPREYRTAALEEPDDTIANFR